MTENIQVSMEDTHQDELAIVVSDDSVASVSVLIQEHELEAYKKEYIKEKRKHVVLRGYRKGTAPIEMVARFFKDEARESARDNVIYAKYMKLLREHKLQPLTPPKLEHLKDEAGQIAANISVEVLQPVVLGQYLGLELQKMPEKSVDDAVLKALTEIKYNYPKLTDVTDVAAVDGNVVTVDFVMTQDGKEIEKQNGFKINLGASLFYREFETHIVGMKVEETKEFDLTFPDSYQREDFRGKTVHFVLTVKLIQATSEYDNDELASVLGYESQEKMLELLTKDINDKIKDDERLFYENQILGQLLTSHQFNIPNKLVEDELRRIFAEKSDLNPAQAREIAERFIKTDLILHAIYERHPDIHFKQEDFDAKIADLAAKANDTVANVLQRLQQTNKLQTYVNYLTNCRVIDFLIEMSDKVESPAVVENQDNNVITEEKDNG